MDDNAYYDAALTHVAQALKFAQVAAKQRDEARRQLAQWESVYGKWPGGPHLTGESARVYTSGAELLIDQRDDARRQLAEARKIVWLLLRFAKQVPSFLPREGGRLGGAASSLDMAFNALPGWLKRRINR